MKPTASLGALLLVLAGTACEAQPVAEPGPEAGSGPRSVDAAASREDPATVLDRFLRAYARGDGDRACDLVTAAHAESIRVDGFAVADSCAEAVMSNAWVLEELGAPERYEITVTRMDAAVAELAVAYPATGARRRTSETWSMSREDGRWLVAGES